MVMFTNKVPKPKFKIGDRVKYNTSWDTPAGTIISCHYSDIIKEYYCSVKYDNNNYVSNVQENNLILIEEGNKATNWTSEREDKLKMFSLEKPDFGGKEEKEYKIEEGSSGDIFWREDIGYVEVAKEFKSTPDYMFVSKVKNYEEVAFITNIYLIKVFDYKENKYTDFAEDSLLNFYDILYEVVYSELNTYPDGTHIKSARGLDIVLKYNNKKPYFEYSNGEALNLSSIVLSELYLQPILKTKIKRNDILDKFHCDDFDIID